MRSLLSPSKLLPLIQDALTELASHKMRTLLTLLGMIFGVGAVIAMLNIGEGAERQALKMIDSMGLRNIIIEAREYSDEELKEIRQESLGLMISDAEAAVATLPFVEHYSAIRNIKIQNLFSDYAKTDAMVLGVSDNHFELSNLETSHGRLFDAKDNLSMAQVAVLGAGAAQQLFPNQEPLNKMIKVNHLWLKVIGILKSPYAGQDEFQGVTIGKESMQIFLPLRTAIHKLNRGKLESELDSIKLKVAENTDPMVASSAIKRLFDMRHGGTDDYQVIVPAALLAQQKQTQQIFNIVMACVAGISLLVGGIGIMNIMLATVLERTKEIGLLRAIGATQEDIKMQFITESFSISVIGALIGVIFGLMLSEIIGFYSGWAVSWSLQAIVLSVVICLLTGIGFGVFPAVKASKLNPIDALHSD